MLEAGESYIEDIPTAESGIRDQEPTTRVGPRTRTPCSCASPRR
jgi:hypothetical protein